MKELQNVQGVPINMGIKWRLPYRLCSKLYYFVNIFVNFKIFKKVDHILKSSSDVQSFFLPFMSFINNLKSKTTFKSSLNSHIYWDTMYLVWSFLTFKTIAWWSILILHLSVVWCVHKKKFVKHDSTEVRSVHTNSESFSIWLGS